MGSRTSTVNGGTTNYESNKLNQYTSVGGTNYTYDNNGNLTYDGSRTYIYDNESRLIEVRQGVTTVASYKYDFAGRRVRKIVGGVVTDYLYDGFQCIAEYNGTTSALLRRFFYGPGIDEPICRIHVYGETEAKFYYHFDGLGSVVALSDENADVAEKYSYDVYGKPTIRGPGDEPRTTSLYYNRYMFTGREYDTSTGLYYYRARWYNPEIGRFMQTDLADELIIIVNFAGEYNYIKLLLPQLTTRMIKLLVMGELQTYDTTFTEIVLEILSKPLLESGTGMNSYRYVDGNPTNWVDPSGLRKTDPFWFVRRDHRRAFSK